MRFKTDGCQPGDLIAVPLDRGGWAVALVVRVVPYVSGRPPHAIHTYGFGRLFDSCPVLEQALAFRITDAVCLDYGSGYQVWAGSWPRLGSLPGFAQRDWPMPPKAGTVGPRYGKRGHDLTVHVTNGTGDGIEVFSDSSEQFVLFDEYSQLPHRKGLGDAAALSAALSLAIHEHHPWHYYPVTEERLTIWKRVMDRIIKHKPELAAVVGPWYTGIEVPEAVEPVPDSAPKKTAMVKKSAAAVGEQKNESSLARKPGKTGARHGRAKG